jgi:peptide/nickel transport system permease protein
MSKHNQLFLAFFACLVFLLFFIPLFFNATVLTETHLSKAFCSPGDCGWFGLGENGMDLFAHTLSAAQIALVLSSLVCLTSLMIGVPMGLIASLSKTYTDQSIMLLTNLFLSFPSILVAIALSAFLGQGFFTLWIILSLTGWAPFCRLARGAALQAKSQEYIHAAETMGCRLSRISLKHILPNIFPILLVQAAFQLSGIIIVESTLSFLGLGLSQETPSLGRLVFIGKNYLLDYPHTALIPGVFIVLLIMGFYISGMILDLQLTHREVVK